MTDCPFIRQPDGTWKCPDPPDGCGFHYRRTRSKPPRHRCGDPHAPRIRLAHDLDRLYAEEIPGRDRCEVEATLTHCFGGCEHFTRSTCTRWGSACTHRQRWIEALIFNGCDLAEGKIQGDNRDAD